MPPKRSLKPCPSGYICNICSTSGHWVFDCAQYVPKRTRKKKKTEHAYVEGIDPSPEDIAKAKEMQKSMRVNVKAPNCFCGLPSKMRKCLRTEDENSKALGVMFWWCNKDKWDEDRCKFARRVDQGGRRVCKFWRETGGCKKGDEVSRKERSDGK